MSNLYFAASYKNKIINLLLKNEDFRILINPQSSKCDEIDVIDILLGGSWIVDGVKYEEQGHVFDYNFVDETTTEEKTFVFVETDIDYVQDNIFTNFNLYVCIFTAKSLVRLSQSTVPTVDQVKQMGYFASTHANRIDVLCDIIDRILNGNNKFCGLGDVKPATKRYVSIYTPNSNYYGKCLKYNITNFNTQENGCNV